MRAQLGDTVWFICYTGSGVDAPQDPDAAPTLTVIDGSTTYGPYPMPPIFPRITGMFALEVFLGDNWARPFTWTTGQKIAIMKWQISAAEQAELVPFKIMPGGNVDGAVLSLAFYNRPQSKMLVQQLQSGKLIRGVSPRF